MFTATGNNPEKNLMSGANRQVFDPVRLQEVPRTHNLPTFHCSEYSQDTAHSNGINYWRANEIVGYAREKVPNRDELVVVVTSRSTHFLEGNRECIAALKEAGALLKNGKIPLPIKLNHEGIYGDPNHNVILIADYYPEFHAIVLRESAANLSSTVNTEDHLRISNALYEVQKESNKIVVVAEVRTYPGKQLLDKDTLDGILHQLKRCEVSHAFLFRVDAILTTFSLSATQAKQLFEVATTRAVESASCSSDINKHETANHSAADHSAADNSAAAFEIAVAALNAVQNPHEISELIWNAFDVGGKVVRLLAQAKATEHAHGVVNSMDRVPNLA